MSEEMEGKSLVAAGALAGCKKGEEEGDLEFEMIKKKACCQMRIFSSFSPIYTTFLSMISCQVPP